MRVECVRKAFEKGWVGEYSLREEVVYKTRIRILLDKMAAAHPWYMIHVKGVSRPPDMLSQYNTDVLLPKI